MTLDIATPVKAAVPIASLNKSDKVVIAKFFRGPGDTLKTIVDEIKNLTSSDVDDLATGIRDGSLTY